MTRYTLKERRRARLILMAIAEGTELSSVREWVTRDERGVLERSVINMLRLVEVRRASDSTFDMSDGEVNDGIATHTELSILKAMIRNHSDNK